MKKREAQLIIEEMQAKEAEQKRRENEIKQRDERMQKIMNRMGEAGVGGKREKELLK
jgi:hypothetical protein